MIIGELIIGEARPRDAILEDLDNGGQRDAPVQHHREVDDDATDVLSERASNTVINQQRRKEGHVLFNDALNTCYLRLYGFRHMVNDHSDSERGNPLPPHGLLFPISSKVSFICTIPETG